MNIQKYKKKGRTYYKFQTRIGDNVTRRSGFETKNDAIKAYIDLQENYERLSKGRLTFQELYDKWLLYYKTTVKQATYKNVLTVFRIHILPVFGDKLICNITPNECQEFILTLTDYKKGRWMYNQAKRVMDYAVTIELIESNPFSKVIRPKFKEPEAKVHFLEIEDVNKILDELKDDLYWYTIFRLFVYSGLRRGELLALTWNDIDFNKKTLEVNKTLTVGEDYKVIVDTPKTKKSNRTILLDDDTIHSLKKLKIKTKSELIFPNSDGDYKRLSDVQDKLNSLTKKLGIKKTRVHDLRHTHATLLFSSGASIKEVQDRLGHSDIKTTMNIYTHVRKSDEKKAVDNFAKFMSS